MHGRAARGPELRTTALSEDQKRTSLQYIKCDQEHTHIHTHIGFSFILYKFPAKKKTEYPGKVCFDADMVDLLVSVLFFTGLKVGPEISSQH